MQLNAANEAVNRYLVSFSRYVAAATTIWRDVVLQTGVDRFDAEAQRARAVLHMRETVARQKKAVRALRTARNAIHLAMEHPRHNLRVLERDVHALMRVDRAYNLDPSDQDGAGGATARAATPLTYLKLVLRRAGDLCAPLPDPSPELLRHPILLTRPALRYELAVLRQRGHCTVLAQGRVPATGGLRPLLRRQVTWHDPQEWPDLWRRPAGGDG